MSTEIRILVTGSRTWTDEPEIRKALEYYRWGYQLYAEPYAVTLVSGACPPRWVNQPDGTLAFVKGADRIAEEIADGFGWTVERYPADWDRYGNSAGHVRNYDMVKLGATVCLAFIENASKGATGCARMAETAGIPVRRWIR